MPGTSRPSQRPKHDGAYRKLFGHPRTVADLLRGFAGDLSRHLDFTTLERLPASFVSEHLGQRHADMLWKIRTVGGGWLYLMVLLEFQSTVDSRMALRMLDYTVQILLALGREDRGPGGALPPVLPVVIYNGERRWDPAMEMRDLFAPVPAELVGYLPRHRYSLLDLRALDPSRLPPENVVSLVAMLEQAGSAGQLEHLGASLADWLLRMGETALLDAFEAWITQVLAARADPAGRSMELRTWNRKEGPMSTLAERVKKWGDELNQAWLEKGIEQGRQEARELLYRMTARRFGSSTAEQLRPLLEGISDPDRIAAIADGVVECRTGDEFLARARER